MASYSHKRSPSRKTPAKRKPISGIAWIVLGVLLGLLAAMIVFTQYPSPLANIHSTKKIAAKKEISNKQAGSPEFDFYTVLPQDQASSVNNKIAVPPAPTTQPAATITTPAASAVTSALPAVAKTPAAPSANSQQYWLQIASVSNFAEADRYKAELIMSGLNASIQSYTTNNRTYNRVLMGPYATPKEAQKIQAQLKEQRQLKSIIVKMR